MIKIVAVGKIKEKALRTQIEEYEKRLRPFTKLEIIEVNDEVAPQSNSDSQNNQVKEKEGERILAKIKEQEYVMKISGVKKLKLICSSDDSEMKKAHPEYQKDLPVKKGAVSIHLPAYSARFYQVVE